MLTELLQQHGKSVPVTVETLDFSLLTCPVLIAYRMLCLLVAGVSLWWYIPYHIKMFWCSDYFV